MGYEYGVQRDRQRFIDVIIAGGGQHTSRLDKMKDGKPVGVKEFSICDINHPLATTVTSRYYKGISAHKDNMVLEICKLEKHKNL